MKAIDNKELILSLEELEKEKGIKILCNRSNRNSTSNGI